MWIKKTTIILFGGRNMKNELLEISKDSIIDIIVKYLPHFEELILSFEDR